MKQKYHSPSSTGFLIINQMLGTGPLIIPSVFILGGIGLSSIFLILICTLSFISTLYLCEAHSICNFLKYQQKLESEDQLLDKNKENLQENLLENNNNNDQDYIRNIVKSKEENQNDSQVKIYKNNNNENEISEINFQVTKIYNYGEMGFIIFGKGMQILISVMIVLQLIGAISSKVIMTSNIMKGVFSEIKILGDYYFWCTLCYFITAIMSFKEIINLKWFSNIVAILRITIILLFILAPIYIIIQNGSYPLIGMEYQYPGHENTFYFKTFNFKALPQIFSNLIFAYMAQNSVVNITGILKPQSKIKYVVFFVYLFAFTVCFLVSIMGQLAFGGAATDPYDVNNIIYFNTNFKEYIPWFYYFSSFYIFCNVSALPVMAIIIRNNLMKLFVPEKLVDCGTNFELNRWTIGFTSFILLLCYLSSMLLQNYIQYLLNVTNGTSGVCLMLLFPFSLAIQGRRKISQKYNINQKQYSIYNKFYAVVADKGGFLPYILLGLSFFIFILNLYQQIEQIITDE